MRARNLVLLLVVLLVFGWQAWQRRAGEAGGAQHAPSASSTSAPAAHDGAAFPSFPQSTGASADTGTDAGARDTAGDTAGLPREVAPVLAAIRAGGPFRYDRDGVVFGNFEGRLPRQPRGYYHEYTVPTPGARNRGARRIIAGGNPPDEFWYTGDHYESFVRLDGGAGAVR